MNAQDRYQTASSFRTALEQRLRAEAQASAVPLNRLRKDAAFNRLLARLHRAAPQVWALKGGLALIARLGPGIRGTNDADANWRGDRSALEDALAVVEDLDLNDWFAFIVGDARPLQGEGTQGALRYSVTASLGGRVFEHLSLDVNIIAPSDPRPSGPKLAATVRETFSLRSTDWPPRLAEPPADWHRPWSGFIMEYPLPWSTLDTAFDALMSFWNPLLTGSAANKDATWRRELWRWN